MIPYKKFTAMVTAATTALVMTVSFGSEAADLTGNKIYTGEPMSVQAFADIMRSVPNGAVQDTQKMALDAQEKYEKKQLEEKKLEEKKAAEERRRAEEEAARQAEQIAAEQAAAEAQAAEVAAQNIVQAAAGEQELLAALIYCEAGNQPYEGQVAVGAVVMNRVRSGVYPNSISEVIYQPGQFGPAMTGWLDSVLASGGYTPAAMQAAADALAGSNPIGEFLYFDCGGVGYQLGDHFFH